MPLENYPQAGFELLDDRLPLWRFMKMWTFTRFVESGSLHFSRADLLGDEHEGLPPEDYVRQVVAGMGPGHSFESSWEMFKQDRKASFVCCWTLDESIHMWEKFAPQGVAVKTNSGLLKTALNEMHARTMLGYIRYSLEHEGGNILRFITTKRPEFAPEQEVRAFAWQMEYSPRNPHPHDEPSSLLFPIDLRFLIQSVIVSPHAPATIFDEVRNLLNKYEHHDIPVVKSAFTGFGHLLPSTDEIARILRR